MSSLTKLSEFRNVLLFALLAALWGTSYVAIDVGLADLPPFLFGAARYDLAGAVLLAVAVATGSRLRPRTRSEWATVAVGGVFLVGLHIGALFLGQRYVSGGTAAVVLSTIPVLTPVFAWSLLGRQFGLRTGVGALLGLVGVAVIASPSSIGSPVGVGLLFLSAASFAFGAVLLDRLPSSLSAATSQTWMMLVGALLLHGASAVAGESTTAPSTTGLLAFVYLAVACGAGGYLVYFDLLRRVGSVRVSLTNYAVPVVAAVSGWALLGESLSASTLAGFALVATGFATMEWTLLVALQARFSRGYATENEYVDASARSATPVADD